MAVCFAFFFLYLRKFRELRDFAGFYFIIEVTFWQNGYSN
jgi:hypothetical protein